MTKKDKTKIMQWLFKELEDKDEIIGLIGKSKYAEGYNNGLVAGTEITVKRVINFVDSL